LLGTSAAAAVEQLCFQNRTACAIGPNCIRNLLFVRGIGQLAATKSPLRSASKRRYDAQKLVLRKPSRWRRAGGAGPLEASDDKLRRRGKEETDEDNQESKAYDAYLRRLVGRGVENDECEQESKKEHERRPQPTVAHPALQHLVKPNHGSGW
jgi:hypothetical protein